MRWTISQIGARQHYSLPEGFQEIGGLRHFFTEAWCPAGQRCLRHGPPFLRSFANRNNPRLDSRRVTSFNLSYAGFRWANYPRGRSTVASIHEYYLREGAWFGRRVREVLSQWTFDTAEDAFLAFNTGALEPLEMLRDRGVFTVVDQIDPGPEHERLVAREREKWPGWEKAVDPVPNEYWARLRAEWRVAEAILVNSEWSKAMLEKDGVPGEKVIVAPISCKAAQRSLVARQHGGRLVVLWLGNLTLAKGIAYFLDAAERLPSVRFVVAGGSSIDPSKLARASGNVEFLGRVPRDKVGEVYRAADVFVLPTLSDGFAITQLEAMAQGLPVIATPNCGRVVTHGQDGLLIPPASGEALADAIATLDADRGRLREMSESAVSTVQRFAVPSDVVRIEAEVARLRSRR